MIEYLKTYLWYVFDKDCFEVMCNINLKPNSNGFVFCDNEEHNEYIDMIWSIMVLKFGDYGVAPWAGWIETDKLSDAIKYIINELYTNDIYAEGGENE